MSFRTWSNGERASVIKNIIDNNFKMISKYFKRLVMSLSTDDIKNLPIDYYTTGSRVFDTTLGEWFEFDGLNWVKCNDFGYIYNFDTTDWTNNSISIPYSKHRIDTPVVQVYMLNSDAYIPVLGGVSVDSSNNVTLSTDLIFKGRVVIK